MSLKDEIEKIIQAEQAKLESRAQAHREYGERQRHRFQPLRALLSELAASIDPTQLHASIGEDRATIEVGEKGSRTRFETVVRWRIEPNFDVSFSAAKGESLLQETPGFKVDEEAYYRFPEDETCRHSHMFDTEEQVMSYLVGKIAEQVALYRHSAARRTAVPD